MVASTTSGRGPASAGGSADSAKLRWFHSRVSGVLRGVAYSHTRSTGMPSDRLARAAHAAVLGVDHAGGMVGQARHHAHLVPGADQRAREVQRARRCRAGLGREVLGHEQHAHPPPSAHAPGRATSATIELPPRDARAEPPLPLQRPHAPRRRAASGSTPEAAPVELVVHHAQAVRSKIVAQLARRERALDRVGVTLAVGRDVLLVHLARAARPAARTCSGCAPLMSPTTSTPPGVRCRRELARKRSSGSMCESAL